jgi:transcriptional regulator of arginine metabolism
LVKTPQGYREIGRESSAARAPDVAGVLDEFLTDVRVAQNLVVLKTSSGHASTVAVALDSANWPEIVGTIAGDDTVLIVAPDALTADAVSRKVRGG